MKQLGYLAIIFALFLPVTAAAQEPPQRPPAERATEIGIYVYHVGSVLRFVGGDGKLIEFRKLDQFIMGIGGTAADYPGRDFNEEQANGAVLNVLARQGWQLVSCQLFTRIDHDYMYSCYLKRAVRQAEN